jgi:hypothetical protein
MTIYSGSDFVLVNDNPVDNTTSAPSVTVTDSPAPTEETTTAKTPVGSPFVSDLSLQEVNKTFSNLVESTTYSKSIDLTCSVSGSSTISYVLQANAPHPLPGWVSLDPTNKLLNFKTPEVSSNTNYTFNIVATESGINYSQTIYLGVMNKEEEEEILESIKATSITTQAIVGVGVLCASFASFLTGTSPQGAWSMINQIQLFLLLPILVDSMPNDVSNFIYGMEKFSFSFNFIPYKDLSFIQNVFELVYFEQDNIDLEKIGIESK